MSWLLKIVPNQMSWLLKIAMGALKKCERRFEACERRLAKCDGFFENAIKSNVMAFENRINSNVMDFENRIKSNHGFCKSHLNQI